MSAYDFEGNDWDAITEAEKRYIVQRLVDSRDALSDDYETLAAEHDLCATSPPGAGREEQLDFIAQAERIRAEHDATHGEAEMCGAECIVLGLTDDDEAAPGAGREGPCCATCGVLVTEHPDTACALLDEAAPGAGSSPDLRSALDVERLAAVMENHAWDVDCGGHCAAEIARRYAAALAEEPPA